MPENEEQVTEENLMLVLRTASTVNLFKNMVGDPVAKLMANFQAMEDSAVLANMLADANANDDDDGLREATPEDIQVIVKAKALNGELIQVLAGMKQFCLLMIMM